ncbi:hypothetical protein KI387_021917, partial [Taxus chinensis]
AIPQDKIEEQRFKNITKVVTLEELQKSVFTLEGDKAPGPDGFSINFFQKFWEICSDDLLRVVNEFYRTRNLLKELNNTHIVLAPKKMDAKDFKEFRPISLVNAIYRIFTKIIATRLQLIMNDLISRQQSGFIKGRIIQDGVIMVHETIHSMENNKK